MGGGGGGDSLRKSGSSETKEAHTSCIAKYFLKISREKMACKYYDPTMFKVWFYRVGKYCST